MVGRLTTLTSSPPSCPGPRSRPWKTKRKAVATGSGESSHGEIEGVAGRFPSACHVLQGKHVHAEIAVTTDFGGVNASLLPLIRGDVLEASPGAPQRIISEHAIGVQGVPL